MIIIVRLLIFVGLVLIMVGLVILGRFNTEVPAFGALLHPQDTGLVRHFAHQPGRRLCQRHRRALTKGIWLITDPVIVNRLASPTGPDALTVTSELVDRQCSTRPRQNNA